jgi:hypothetical protein
VLFVFSDDFLKKDDLGIGCANGFFDALENQALVEREALMDVVTQNS